MAISCAVQRGNSVYVYNDHHNVISSIQGILQGFTSNTVTINRGAMIYVYELSASGQSIRCVATHSAR